jgi:hypothetical protein
MENRVTKVQSLLSFRLIHSDFTFDFSLDFEYYDGPRITHSHDDPQPITQLSTSLANTLTQSSLGQPLDQEFIHSKLCTSKF